MSRIGKQPVQIPSRVKVTVTDRLIQVEGPLGKLQREIDPLVLVSVQSGVIQVKPKTEERESASRQGLTRNLIRNMVEGVSQGYKKDLQINGVGYRAEVKGNVLNLSLGFSHPVFFPIPEGIKIHVEKQVNLQVSGVARELVGETAARIRKLKKPEPYKGKGIKYAEEVILRKVGKAAAGSSAGGK